MSTNFQEQVRSPSWVYLLLGLFLGLNSAIATGIFVVGIIREPIFQGLQAYIFYISFLGSAIICFYLLIYFTIVKIIIESNNLINFNLITVNHFLRNRYRFYYKCDEFY